LLATKEEIENRISELGIQMSSLFDINTTALLTEAQKKAKLQEYNIFCSRFSTSLRLVMMRSESKKRELSTFTPNSRRYPQQSCLG
jgi:hypothetical protein